MKDGEVARSFMAFRNDYEAVVLERKLAEMVANRLITQSCADSVLYSCYPHVKGL